MGFAKDRIIAILVGIIPIGGWWGWFIKRKLSGQGVSVIGVLIRSLGSSLPLLGGLIVGLLLGRPTGSNSRDVKKLEKKVNKLEEKQEKESGFTDRVKSFFGIDKDKEKVELDDFYADETKDPAAKMRGPNGNPVMADGGQIPNQGGGNSEGLELGSKIKGFFGSLSGNAKEHYKVLIVLFIVLPILFIFVLPGLISGIGSAIGFTPAAEYGGFFGEVAGERAMNVEFPWAQHMMIEAGNHFRCIWSGPECLMDLRANQTSRPGSEDAGTGNTYGLDIDRFNVGTVGGGVEIAGKDPDYTLPVTFTISNPRYGLKGIEAYNVSYRIKIIGTDRDEDNPYCDTGWRPVDGFDLRDDEAEEPWTGNDILPGTAANMFVEINHDNDENTYGTTFGDELTLEECEMMQPGLRDSRQVELDVRYDYFSQSTLDFEVMSHRMLQEGVNVGEDVSVTADTPAQAALAVESPVFFQDGELNTFDIRATLNTDRFNVEYKVRDLLIRMSDQTSVGPGECSFEPDEAEEILRLDDAVSGEVIAEHASEDLDWFDRREEPPFFGCDIELDNPEELSPTGETLTKHVEANYTVAKEDNIPRFSVNNRLCGNPSYECPILVTRQYAEQEGGGAIETAAAGRGVWKTECEGWGSGRRGCSVVLGPGEDGVSSGWARSLMTASAPHLDTVDQGGEYMVSNVESGEVAIDIGRIDELSGVDDFVHRHDLGNVAAGVDPDVLDDISVADEFVLYHDGSQVIMQEGLMCEDQVDRVQNPDGDDAYLEMVTLIGGTDIVDCEELEEEDDEDYSGLSESECEEEGGYWHDATGCREEELDQGRAGTG